MVEAGQPDALVKYWELVPAIVGGVIGSLAGGIPAWLIAKRQSDETLKRDREGRLEGEKALAFRVSAKLLTITNSVITLRNHVRSGSLRCESGMEPWQALTPMIGHTTEGTERFEADEMAVFAAAGERDFMMDLSLLALRHATSVESFKTYCDRRDDLTGMLPVPQQYDGEVGSSFLSLEEVNSLKRYTIPLNNIAVALLEGVEKDLSLARSVSIRFGPIVKRYFNDPEFVALTFPTDAELDSMPTA